MAKKYYSTLKIQQEYVKAVCKDWQEPRDINWIDGKDGEIWLVYHGYAIYRVFRDELAINIKDRKPKMSDSLLDNLNDIVSNGYSLKYIRTELTGDKKELVIFEDESGMEHYIDNKFLNLTNFELSEYSFNIKQKGKVGIVAVINEHNELMAGICEINKGQGA